MTVDTTTGEVMEPLSASEFVALRDAEKVIDAGLQTFVEVGQALAEIRDSRLYRNSHGTFEAYCEQRWNLSRKRAYDLMGAAETVSALSPMGDTPLPTSERQARELRNLDPEPAAEVMREAHQSTGGKVTAKAIREARSATAAELSAGYVEQFPALAFFRDRGEHERVNGNGRDLAAMEPAEQARRLDILDKTIAHEKRVAQTPSPEPRGEAGSGEGQTSSEASAATGVEAGGQAPEVQPERVESSPTPRPAVTGLTESVTRNLTALFEAMTGGRLIPHQMRAVADGLHDLADELENRDAQQ